VSNEFEIEGLEQLVSRLNALGDVGKELEKRAVKEGAEIMRNAIEEAVPRSYRHSNHAKDHIVIGEIEDGKIPIGPDKKNWYLMFPEFGTSKQPAQGFMSKAFNDTKAEAQSKIAEVVRGSLNL